MLTTGKAWVFACIFLCLDNLTNGIVLEGMYTIVFYHGKIKTGHFLYLLF